MDLYMVDGVEKVLLWSHSVALNRVSIFFRWIGLAKIVNKIKLLLIERQYTLLITFHIFSIALLNGN